MNKRLPIIVAVVAAGVIGIFLLPKQGADKLARKVGVILPLTGDAAAYGKSMRQGMELALGQVNNNSQTPVRLFYEDSKADPKIALSAYRNLVTRHKLRAILGPFTSGETLALAPVAESDGVVILSTGASAPSITTAGDFTFRIVTSDLFDGDVVARFVKEKLSLGRIAIAYVNNDYGVGVREAFSRRFEELGGTIVIAEGYGANDPDYRTLLAKIKNASPEGLMLFGYKEMGKILKEARELGLVTPVVSTGLFEDPDVLKTAGDAAEGIYYSFASYNPSSTDATIKNFVTSYNTAYHSEPDILAALGYDAVRVINEAYSVPAATGENIRDKLYSIQAFPGVTGDMSFDKNGDVTKPFGIKRVVNGRFTWVIERF